eukprot:6473194-Amphidinium_carterae.3
MTVRENILLHVVAVACIPSLCGKEFGARAAAASTAAILNDAVDDLPIVRNAHTIPNSQNKTVGVCGFHLFVLRSSGNWLKKLQLLATLSCASHVFNNFEGWHRGRFQWGSFPHVSFSTSKRLPRSTKGDRIGRTGNNRDANPVFCHHSTHGSIGECPSHLQAAQVERMRHKAPQCSAHWVAALLLAWCWHGLLHCGSNHFPEALRLSSRCSRSLGTANEWLHPPANRPH